MTVSVWPRDDSPAVSAKGTVRPSANPRVKSARKREREGREKAVILAWRWAGFRSRGMAGPSSTGEEGEEDEEEDEEEVLAWSKV